MAVTVLGGLVVEIVVKAVVSCVAVTVLTTVTVCTMWLDTWTVAVAVAVTETVVVVGGGVVTKQLQTSLARLIAMPLKASGVTTALRSTTSRFLTTGSAVGMVTLFHMLVSRCTFLVFLIILSRAARE